MNLPNAHLAIVEREKITNYLLNREHRCGASKARFFAEFGFAPEAWEAMAAEFRVHAQAHEVARWRETGFGPRYGSGGRDNRARWPASARAHRLADG